jgi:hypothetical protein
VITLLEIVQLPDNHTYCLPTSIGTGSTYWRVLLKPLIGPLINGQYSAPKSLSKIYGELHETGQADQFDDKPCHHQNVHGFITLNPFPQRESLVKPTVVSPIRMYEVQNSLGAWVEHSGVLSPGVRQEFDVTPTDAAYQGRRFITIAELDANGQYGLLVVAVKRVGLPFVTTVNHFVLDEATHAYYCQDGFSMPNLTDAQIHSLKIESIPVTKWKKATKLTPQFVAIDPHDVQNAINMFHYNKSELSDHFLPSTLARLPYAFGDLAQSCIEQVRYLDINSLAFTKELIEVRDIFKLKGLVNLKSPKTWASVFLAFRYGMNLSLQDTDDIVTGVKRAVLNSKQFKVYTKLYASHVEQREQDGLIFTDNYHYKITCSPYPDELRSLIRTMKRWDIDPSLGNLWDLIPYSFVVDWFVDVSSLLDRIDSQTLLETYQVYSVCRSRKVSVTIPISRLIPTFPGQGDILLTEYIREVTPHLDMPVWRIDETTDFHNFAELGAIIVQKVFK